MGEHKSQSVFYGRLHSELYLDLADRVGIPVAESQRDISRLEKRLAAEGLPFLTVALPTLGKAVDSALLSGILATPTGFKKKPGEQIPKLFGYLFAKVFHRETGALYESPCIDAIRALRQLAYFVYKLELQVDEDKAQKVLSEFVRVDEELDTLQIPDDNTTDVARMFTTSVFGLLDPSEVIPRHGPGAVATGEKSHEKHVFKRIYKDIEEVYPFTEYFCYSLSHVCDAYDGFEGLESLQSGTAKVVLVPKDSRGPRIISCEPLEYQWIQQGLGTKIQRHLQGHRLTAGHVNFDDQTINRRLALQASIDHKWVTLDMKEASDRVSLKLVEKLFSDCPRLLMALCATRSRNTRLPNGTVMQLNKFAPMGSNLCFPIESFVFYALAVSAIMNVYNLPLRKARKSVYVYGDDLIVSSEVYAAVLHHLPKYGLMFNLSKCCTSGSFRESCGCDAFAGVDITPLRLKKVFNHRRVDATSTTSYVALSNAAYARGFYRLANHVQHLVDGQLVRAGHSPLHYTDCEVGVLTWIGRQLVLGFGQTKPKKTIRFRKKADRPFYGYREVYGPYPASQSKRADPDNWSTVLRRLSSSAESAPGVYAVPHRSNLKWGWSPVPR